MRLVYVEASAPTRIDLAGGTLDIWPLYVLHDGVQTVNAAISLRATCRVTPCPSEGVRLVASDAGRSVDLVDFRELPADAELALLGRLVEFFRPHGIELTARSESPYGAGLGGSSALAVAAAAALARWQNRAFAPATLVDLVRNLEARALGVPTGVQDYPPALFGGIAALELGPDRVERVALPVDPGELARRIVLVYTGASRRSAFNNWEILKRRLDGDRQVADALDAISRIARALRHALVQGDWDEVGRQIAAEWHARQALAPGVTTARITHLLETARRAGAQSGKICGAGGGGCLLVWTDPPAHGAVRQALAAAGAQVLDFRIDTEGLRVTQGGD